MPVADLVEKKVNIVKGIPLTSSLEPVSTIDLRDAGTPDQFVFRDPSMIRLTGKHPFNAEPPLKALEESGYVTPNQLHFVRNHGPVPQISWDEHRLEITGLVNKPVTLTMDDILSLPPTTLPVTMVCAGNRRREQNIVKQSIGFGWGASGVSTACWTGVHLRDVINYFAGGLKDGANFICFQGCDKTSKGGYGTSIQAQRAMSDQFDVMLCYKMNGELLPPDHGFPLRVLVPGCIGGRSVKWLTRIEASAEESTNPFHFNDNKVFPPVVQSAEQATAEDWWKRPEYAIYDLNINSAITVPQHGEHIMLQNLQDTYVVRGYAYTGGNRKIHRVEVSLDSGKTWLMADLNQPPAEQLARLFGGELRGPSYYRESRNWTWVRWSLEIDVADLVRADEIVVRAWDNSQNTQPENLTWNLMGMMNNCWFRVKLTLFREPNLSIVCEHPTVSGTEPGGWMERVYKKESQEEAAAAVPNKTSLPTYTMAQVEAHQSETDCWIVVHGLVYDCTSFLKDHPGGASSILLTAGTDCTEEFDAIHSSKAQDMLRDYLVGQVAGSSEATSEISSSTGVESQKSSEASTLMSSIHEEEELPPFLHVKQWKKVVLESKMSLSPTIRLFRFIYEPAAAPFGLPVGQHVYLKLPQEQTSLRDGPPKSVMRAYTPSHCEPGAVEFIVKIYYPDNEQPGGVFTQLLDKVRVGETVDIKGPLGEYEYLGNGSYTIQSISKRAKHIGMIAGGTGITPMWQVLDAMRQDNEPPFVSLIYCVRFLDDLVLAKEIEKLQDLVGRDRLHIRYIVSKPPAQGWEHGRGRLSESEVREHLFPFVDSENQEDDKMVLLCGSDGMIEQCCKPLISKIYGQEFASKHIFVF